MFDLFYSTAVEFGKDTFTAMIIVAGAIVGIVIGVIGLFFAIYLLGYVPFTLARFAFNYLVRIWPK